MIEETAQQKTSAYPLLSSETRARVWRSAKGMWKNKRPDPAKIIRKIRTGLNRRLPTLS